MKKPLLISTTFVVLALSATSIYAQVTSGTSIIDRMKAVAGNFTLSSSLNPGQTGLQSAPVSGKKTGDILTAGEWNRVLELISEGGTGGVSTGTGWEDVSLTDTADFDTSCEYRLLTSWWGIPTTYSGTNFWVYPMTISLQHMVINSDDGNFGHLYSGSKNTLRLNGAASMTVQKMQKNCGGAGGLGGSIRPSSIDSSDRWPATFMSAFNQCKSEGKYLPTAEEALYFVFGGAGTIQNPTSNPLWTITPDDNRNTFVTVYSSGSGMDRTGADSTPYSTTATAYYRCVTGGGGSSSSSGWSDISLTGSTPFDVNCEYRFKASAPGNTNDDAFIGDDNAYNYIQRVHANRLTYQHIGTSYEHINADTKTTLRQNGTPTNPAQTITQIQQRCN